MSKTLTKQEINENLFDEIKIAQEQGVNSFDCAEELGLSAEDTIIAYRHSGFESFRKEVLNEIAETKDGEKPKVITMAQAAYYKGLVAKKHEENSNLKETRGYLLEQVSFLRKAVAFLETRKRELEDGVKGLEKNIGIGITMMEQLEENEGFKKLSPKIEKRNV